MNRFGIKSEEEKQIKTFFEKALTSGQELTVWVFGSRARGTNRPYSDVDLLIEANPALSDAQLLLLRDWFEESSLPYQFDLVPIEKIYAPYAQSVLAERKKFFELKSP